jgi:hypothetical protein
MKWAGKLTGHIANTPTHIKSGLVRAKESFSEGLNEVREEKTEEVPELVDFVWQAPEEN